jgi:hypothetical protein
VLSTWHWVRICISLKLGGEEVGFQVLPGIFAVVHPGKKILGINLDYHSNGSESNSLFMLP